MGSEETVSGTGTSYAHGPWRMADTFRYRQGVLSINGWLNRSNK
ncbi:MAG: hypothetical protein OEY77_14335 [Nitrospira sp.]|nr:hypothetical protein [Nitrospira sp.]